jgi:hypothetical protein
MGDPKKKLELEDIRQAIEAPGAKRIRIHPNTWKRLLQSIAKRGGIGQGGPLRGGNTFSGKPVDLDEKLEEETFEISN